MLRIPVFIDDLQFRGAFNGLHGDILYRGLGVAVFWREFLQAGFYILDFRPEVSINLVAKLDLPFILFGGQFLVKAVLHFQPVGCCLNSCFHRLISSLGKLTFSGEDR